MGVSGRLRELKETVEAFAERPHSSLWLFLVAFTEASLFPLPPDLLLLPLCIAAPRKSLRFAAICAAGSVAGGFAGYAIGYLLFETIGARVVAFTGLSAQFLEVLQFYHQNAWSAIFLAGFTPVPYLVFTIAAGFNLTVDLSTLAVASAAGRLLRFSLVGLPLFLFGSRLKGICERHPAKITLIPGLLFLAGFIVVKVLW